MKALSTQPLSAISVSQALNSTMSVPELMARCMTLSLPASASAALTETVRRGSTKMIRAFGMRLVREAAAFFLSSEVPRRFGTQWLRK